jgi:hypothetical protein
VLSVKRGSAGPDQCEPPLLAGLCLTGRGDSAVQAVLASVYVMAYLVSAKLGRLLQPYRLQPCNLQGLLVDLRSFTWHYSA